MSKLFIDKALELFNLRIEKRNLELGRPTHYNQLNQQRLGMILYPDSEYGSVAVTMSKFSTGKAKSIKLVWVSIICEELKCDANFLFGQPSKFDKEYEKLLEWKAAS